MSIFDEFNATQPEVVGEEVQGQFWCQEQGCFDVIETATYDPQKNMYAWTCDEGHPNTLKEEEIV